jgi:hypothetical protein
MRISDQFSNSFIKTEDLTSLPNPLTIMRVEEEDLGGETKAVVYFRETEKGLPLNRTNAETIAEVLGDETDDWNGATLSLVRDRTKYRGRNVACIRVGTVAAAAAAAAGGPKAKRVKDADNSIA